MEESLNEKLEVLPGEFYIVRDGCQTTEDLVRSGNYFDSSNSITSEFFPVRCCSEKKDIRIIQFIKTLDRVHRAEVMDFISGLGFEKPEHEDTLFFGIQYPEEQVMRNIYFLCGTSGFDMCLWNSGARRRFSLDSKHFFQKGFYLAFIAASLEIKSKNGFNIRTLEKIIEKLQTPSSR